jgi:hypothetical protein
VDTGHWFCSVKMTDQLESFVLLDYPSADLHQTSECLDLSGRRTLVPAI